MGKAVQITVSASGRMHIPADIRRIMGLEKGGTVKVEMIDGALRIQSVGQAISAIQQQVRAAGWHDKISVDEFLAEKRALAVDEQSKMAHLTRS